MKNTTRYFLLTLSPGTQSAETAFMAVVKWPAWQIVDMFEHKNSVHRLSHKGFTGADIQDGLLNVATESELFQFKIAPLELVRMSAPSFLNDVHHVAGTDTGMVVVNTGLDCLEFFDTQWNHRMTYPLVPYFRTNVAHLSRLARYSIKKARTRRGRKLYGHLDQRVPFPNINKLFSPLGLRQSERDLRYYDFRPHFLHPNHVTVHGDAYWVTLWLPGSVIRVPDGKVLVSGLQGPHDGIVHHGEYLVTESLSARLLVFSMQNDVPGKLRLSKQLLPPEGKGFVRGVAATEERLFVGLSALRGEGEYPNARILELDRRTGDIKGSWAVPLDLGRAIFSVVDVTPFYQ